jgi:hypothetical protein
MFLGVDARMGKIPRSKAACRRQKAQVQLSLHLPVLGKTVFLRKNGIPR